MWPPHLTEKFLRQKIIADATVLSLLTAQRTTKPPNSSALLPSPARLFFELESTWPLASVPLSFSACRRAAKAPPSAFCWFGGCRVPLPFRCWDRETCLRSDRLGFGSGSSGSSGSSGPKRHGHTLTGEARLRLDTAAIKIQAHNTG